MDTLLPTLKALADATRLKILALLAQSPRSGDELAALLHLQPSTISHHLARLQTVGLVNVTAEQYYHNYALEPAALAQLRDLLTPEQLVAAVQAQDVIDDNAYRAQILDRWLADGRLQGLPTPIKQRVVVLQWLVEKFDNDHRYAPLQVDAVLDRWCRRTQDAQLDLATVARALVAEQLLTRTGDGRWYWRTDSPLAQCTQNFSPDMLPLAETAPMQVPAYSSLRELVKLALRIKAKQPQSAAEIDRQLVNLTDEQDLRALRTALVKEGLLVQHAVDQYTRPPIGPDHPATVKLRSEAQEDR
jgi:DNA-binding HxlR family transcriptional regulator